MNDSVLILDVGNTWTKAGLFKDGYPLRWVRLAHADTAALRTFLGPERPALIGLGSVARDGADISQELREMAPVHVITGSSPSPLASRIPDRSKLGVDRLANAVGAARLFPGRAALVIDPGTAITYDLVEPDGTHAGGAISPGLTMRAQALHAYSARLPLIRTEEPPLSWIGTATAAALSAGIHFGALGEMQGFIRSARDQWPDLAVVITGGDALQFANALKSGIFAVPLLTLEGLHALLLHCSSAHPPVRHPGPDTGPGPGPTR